MKDILTYIPLGGYLRQWLVAHLGEPVRFPPRSAENALLTRLADRPTASTPPTLKCVGGAVAFVLPDSRRRPPERYYHLSRAAQREVVRAVERLFRLHLWSDCAQLVTAGDINRGLDQWCRDNGISIDHADAVRNKFYRMRRDYDRYGIVIGQRYGGNLGETAAAQEAENGKNKEKTNFSPKKTAL